MDGVIVDSEWFICEAAVRMFAEKGITVKRDDFLPFVGAGEDRYIGGVAEKYGILLNLPEAKDKVYGIYGEIIQGRLKTLPGVYDFLEKCRSRGLKTALATSADKPKMLANLQEIGLEEKAFDVLINGLDVKEKKPSPQIYLLAAGNLGVSPEKCLVVEDAVNGIKAGLCAGCRTLALTTSFPLSAFPDAHWIAADLSEAPDEVLSW